MKHRPVVLKRCYSHLPAFSSDHKLVPIRVSPFLAFQDTETGKPSLEYIDLSGLIYSSRDRRGTGLKDGKQILVRRYRYHTGRSRQGSNGAIEKVADRNGYLKGILYLSYLSLRRWIIVKYHDRLSNLREEFVIL